MGGITGRRSRLVDLEIEGLTREQVCYKPN